MQPTYAQPPQGGMYPQPGTYGMPAQQPPYGGYQQQQMQQPGQYMAGPPQGYGQPQMAGGGQVIVIEQHGGIPGGFGNFPSNCVCPQCHASIMTQVTVQPGVTSWLCCIGLCFVGLWPCALIPVRLNSAGGGPRVAGLFPWEGTPSFHSFLSFT